MYRVKKKRKTEIFLINLINSSLVLITLLLRRTYDIKKVRAHSGLRSAQLSPIARCFLCRKTERELRRSGIFHAKIGKVAGKALRMAQGLILKVREGLL